MVVARWLLWLDPSGTLSAGFPPSAVPLLNAGRLPLVPLLKYGSFEQLLDKLTGALLVLPPPHLPAAPAPTIRCVAR